MIHYRNEWAHNSGFSSRAVYRLADSAIIIVELLGYDGGSEDLLRLKLLRGRLGARVLAVEGD